MNITIIGGGNIGTLMAAEIAKKGHSVTVFSSKPELFNGMVDVYNENTNLLFSSKIHKITNDMGEALNGAHIVWVTVPAQLFVSISKKMLPHVMKNQKIGVVPGSGGVEFAFKDLLAKGCTLFGLQRVHSISRLIKYGHSVMMLGRKKDLQIASIPSHYSSEICEVVRSLFDMDCISLPNYLSVTLTPSNPILHTTRLFSLFNDYSVGIFYSRNFLFYEEWDDASSEILFACDEELQNLCEIIPLDLSSVKSLKSYYESETPSTLTLKIKSIQAFKGLTSPMVWQSNGWVPDFSSRYFTSDFKYGLKIILELGKIFNISMPNINKVWDWYIKTSKERLDDCFKIDLCKEEFLKIYC